MTRWQKFLYWLRKRNDENGVPSGKAAFPLSKHVIQFAFRSGGIDYFQMNDVFNLPYQRGLEAIHAYEELEMRCDKNYLMEHAKVIDEIVNGTRIGLPELERIRMANDQLRQRLDWVVVPDQVYKLASIIYFDASESPTHYELGYAREKIKRWKENDDVDAFFLQKPIQELVPFLKGFSGNFTTYSNLIQAVDKHHWKNLSTKFSEKPESATTVKR